MDNNDTLMNDISISMLIDNGLKRTLSDEEIDNNKPLLFKNNINLDERKIHSWVDDYSVLICYKCNNEFGFFNRKHHCRNCGKIFCYNCSNFFIKIPTSIKTVEKEYNYLDYKTYLEYINVKSNKERVCKKCYDKIFELKELNSIIQFFDKLPLTILDYKRISCVCKSWNKIAKYYFSHFREIQYRFPDHKFTKKELNTLQLNKHLFPRHSKWILQVILSIDWDNSNNNTKKHALQLIHNKNKHIKCWNMLCTRSCSDTLQIEDIVIILSKKITYTPLIKILFDIWKSKIINSDNKGDFELNCYLHVIVNSLHFYKNYTKISNIITKFLLEQCKNNINLSNQLFWILTQCISNPNSSLYFKEFRQKLVKQLDRNTYKLFQNGYDFTQNIIKIVNKNQNNVVPNLQNFIKDCNSQRNQFYLPINFNKQFCYIDYTKIRDIDSKTKPIILPCIYHSSSDELQTTPNVYNIMLKKEDTRKEDIIMRIIKLMDFFLKKEEKLDLYVTTYNILPISHIYGYIEFVPNSKTLYSIREDSNFSIQNWILENNPNITIDELRDNISKSCALYCVITYLLGIGDRHLDNIMITEEGKLFHIDFGYILGQDPKLLSPEIRLTPEMIDAMGGINSKYYGLFKKYCGIGYNCMRRHAPIFYTILLDMIDFNPPLKNNNFTKEQIRQHIINRFIPGENYVNAVRQINHKIDCNSITYSENIIDYFHKKNKSYSKSRSSLSNIIQSDDTFFINGVLDKGFIIKNKLISGFNKFFKS